MNNKSAVGRRHMELQPNSLTHSESITPEHLDKNTFRD